MSFAKCLPIQTPRGEALTAFFDFPHPLFEITVTPQAEIASSLNGDSYSNITYMVAGFNTEAGRWEAYVGETSANFAGRFNSSHRNSPWLKMLDVNTLLFIIVNVPVETSTDFRKALEYHLTHQASFNNIFPLNKIGTLETTHQGIDNQPKIKRIAELTIKFAKTLRNIPSPELKPSFSQLTDRKKEKALTRKYSVGTKLVYNHTRFGVDSQVQAIVTEGNKVILTSIKNAPLFSRFTPAGQEQFHRMKSRYETLLKEGQIHTATQTYSWTGESTPLPLTAPLALLNGVGSANTWRENE